MSQFDTSATFFLCTASCATVGTFSNPSSQLPSFFRDYEPSSTSNFGFGRSLGGDTDSTSSMPSKLSTVCRLAHAEMTDSPATPLGADFALVEDVRDLEDGFLGFWSVDVFFFRGLESSSSESTRRGITSTSHGSSHEIKSAKGSKHESKSRATRSELSNEVPNMTGSILHSIIILRLDWTPGD